MYSPSYFLIFLLLFVGSWTISDEIPFITIEGSAQGTSYNVKYQAKDSLITKFRVDSILKVIDLSLSLYNSKSLIRKFNSDGHFVRMDGHFKKVAELSIETYLQTQGAFDITVKPLVDLWGFGTRGFKRPPTEEEIMSARQCIGSELLQIKGDSLLKTKDCVQIDCNGIAQGYSVDVLADFLETFGIENYLIELGGELRVKGSGPTGRPWKIAIESPVENSIGESIQKIMVLKQGSVTTSGSYRRYYDINGQRYSHLIDPHTGYPIRNNLLSVTVVSGSAAVADGFDNALMVLGIEKSFQLLNKHPELEAYFIYQDPGGKLSDTCTNGFSLLFSNEQ